MKRKILSGVAMASLPFLFSGFALAADSAQTQEKVVVAKQDVIYGSQLMTRQERAEYRARMRAAKTAREREEIRNRHHKEMQERAKARGLSLPDEPPARGAGAGPGGGMGPGSGIGSGGMRRR
jgi:hypothetical protein